MSRFAKSSLTVDGNAVHLSMPFAKVDEEHRLVSGFATLDNIDTQGDIVLAEASAKAFSRARGNIREMHQPIAAGRMVDFREEEFYDPTANGGKGDFFRGIFVTARISEGAQDTWLKVLDGTLTGFSIGGEIKEASNEFVKEAGRTIRFIKDYDLVELSLVDNPANQLANVFSIQKSATGSVTVKGMVAETVIENVFVCPADETVIIEDSENEACPQCGSKMEIAGWFEEGPDRAEKVRDIVTKFLTPAEQEAAPSSSEGGVEMSKKNDVPEGTEVEVVNPSEEFPDGTKVEEEAKDAEEVDETAGTDEEEASSPEEVHDDETEISKKIDALHEAVKKTLEESNEETAKKVEALETRIAEETQSVLTKVSELESKFEEFGSKLETSKSRLAELENRLEKMNASEAFRKSAELETAHAEKDEQKDTLWNGAFSGKNTFSVDNLV